MLGCLNELLTTELDLVKFTHALRPKINCDYIKKKKKIVKSEMFDMDKVLTINSQLFLVVISGEELDLVGYNYKTFVFIGIH